MRNFQHPLREINNVLDTDTGQFVQTDVGGDLNAYSSGFCNSLLSELNKPQYSTNEFRMFCFKVVRCTKRQAHDWRVCPFAHPTENARRRDPREVKYTSQACPDYKQGLCMRGDTCPYAHGVFESWLHPSRYHTQLCKDGLGCMRSVCFFAHSLEELRTPTHTWTVSELLAEQQQQQSGVQNLSENLNQGVAALNTMQSEPAVRNELASISNNLSTSKSLSNAMTTYLNSSQRDAKRRIPSATGSCVSPENTTLQLSETDAMSGSAFSLSRNSSSPVSATILQTPVDKEETGLKAFGSAIGVSIPDTPFSHAFAAASAALNSSAPEDLGLPETIREGEISQRSNSNSLRGSISAPLSVALEGHQTSDSFASLTSKDTRSPVLNGHRSNRDPVLNLPNNPSLSGPFMLSSSNIGDINAPVSSMAFNGEGKSDGYETQFMGTGVQTPLLQQQQQQQVGLGGFSLLPNNSGNVVLNNKLQNASRNSISGCSSGTLSTAESSGSVGGPGAPALGFAVPRMSNAFARRHGLNPKDNPVVNLQKIVQSQSKLPNQVAPGPVCPGNSPVNPLPMGGVPRNMVNGLQPLGSGNVSLSDSIASLNLSNPGSISPLGSAHSSLTRPLDMSMFKSQAGVPPSGTGMSPPGQGMASFSNGNVLSQLQHQRAMQQKQKQRLNPSAYLPNGFLHNSAQQQQQQQQQVSLWDLQQTQLTGNQQPSNELLSALASMVNQPYYGNGVASPNVLQGVYGTGASLSQANSSLMPMSGMSPSQAFHQQLDAGSVNSRGSGPMAMPPHQARSSPPQAGLSMLGDYSVGVGGGHMEKLFSQQQGSARNNSNSASLLAHQQQHLMAMMIMNQTPQLDPQLAMMAAQLGSFNMQASSGPVSRENEKSEDSPLGLTKSFFAEISGKTN